jgi:hypothetical protein
MEREAEGNENERDLENPITTFVGLFFFFFNSKSNKPKKERED